MAYSLSCKDTGSDCPASFTTEDQGELMEHVQLHAERVHPDLELDDATVAQVQGAIKQV